LLTTSWVEKVKDLLGIKAASQVWGDQPAWYLWLSEAVGTYQLLLADPVSDDDEGEIARGIFSVKCYPYTNQEVFQTFSKAERRVLNSRLVDETHTPRFEDRAKIPDDLFNVAVIDYAVNREDSMACLTLESLSTWRVVNDQPKADEGHCHPDDSHRDLDRHVPGWQLALPLFDRLLSMVAFYSKKSPSRIRVTRTSGFEFTRTGSTPMVVNEAADINCYTASVLFGTAGKANQAGGPTESSLMDEAARPEQSEVLCDQSFSENRCRSHGIWTGISDVFPINRLWWSLASADYRSELGSTCGCDGCGSNHAGTDHV
jgi:hypothetical protein